jgi:hypothetical protein
MKLGRNIGSVTIPKHPKTLGGVLSWIKRANRTMEELRNRKVSFPNQGRIGATDTKPPFWVKLNNVGTESSPSYEVEIAWGYVIEIVPGEGDPPQYHEPDNIWEQDPSNPDEVIRGVSRKFAVNVGQAVYIDVKVLADGTVGADDTPPDVDGGDPTANPSVLIYIGAADESSLHYQPKVDTETSDGTPGNILYKLAEIKAAVSSATLATVEKFLTGSHISYFQELPEVKSALGAGSGIGVIPKTWDNAEKSYKFRAIKEKAAVDAIVDPPSVAQAVQIHVVQEADAIVIKGNSKSRTIKYQVSGESAVDVAVFDDGLETLGDVAGNEITIPIPASHPWQVKENDDATMDILKGSILSYQELGLTLREFGFYDGSTTVTVTGEGVIYGQITSELALYSDINAGGTDSAGDTFEVPINRVFPDEAASISVLFASSLPTPSNSYFYFEIAKVTLVSSIAVLSRQILTHNPTLASWIEPP